MKNKYRFKRGTKKENAIMKTKVLLAVTVLAGLAASAQAATGVATTKHDLSIQTAGSVAIGGTDQVCVFCHTPHNAIVNKLLWNRKNALKGSSFAIFTSYNSSGMRTALIGSTVLTDTSTSLLCLSCHSLTTTGGLQTNTILAAGSTAVDNSNLAAQTRWTTKTGSMTNLTNDHPVGINYLTAQLADTTGLKPATGTGLTSATALRLFNGTGGSGIMECASCHLVHDNSKGKFLAMSNSGSALCIGCHTK